MNKKCLATCALLLLVASILPRGWGQQLLSEGEHRSTFCRASIVINSPLLMETEHKQRVTMPCLPSQCLCFPPIFFSLSSQTNWPYRTTGSVNGQELAPFVSCARIAQKDQEALLVGVVTANFALRWRALPETVCRMQLR
jgi:hypothetical protein